MQKSGTMILVAALGLGLCACAADSGGSSEKGNLHGAAANGGGAGNSGGAGTSAFGNGAGNAGTTGSGAAGGGMIGGMGCATANIQAARKQPVVVLVIDGSGSMCAPFDTSTRWQALRSALMDPDGVVTKLQSVVEFGMVMYDGLIDIAAGAGSAGNVPQCSLTYALNQPAGKPCPNLTVVGAALNNEPALGAMYPMTELGGSTPTHYAMATTMDGLIMSRMQNPDQELKPTYVILATDGQPNDYCNTAAMLNPEQEVITQVTRGAMAGIKTFVVSLAGDDMALQAHLMQVAMAGGTGQPPFTPMNKGDLVDTLIQIIGGAVGCEVSLNGKVSKGGECMGYVEVNGVRLPCGDPNGWQLKDERTVELTGAACMEFLNNPQAQLHADFPCGVFIPD